MTVRSQSQYYKTMIVIIIYDSSLQPLLGSYARIVNYDHRLRYKLKHNIRSKIYDHILLLYRPLKKGGSQKVLQNSKSKKLLKLTNLPHCSMKLQLQRVLQCKPRSQLYDTSWASIYPLFDKLDSFITNPIFSSALKRSSLQN